MSFFFEQADLNSTFSKCVYQIQRKVLEVIYIPDNPPAFHSQVNFLLHAWTIGGSHYWTQYFLGVYQDWIASADS